jgi:hypothetical protein
MNSKTNNQLKYITLKDFETRYSNIRKQNPKVKKCSVKGCPNPRDSTELLDGDTCCAYHRILFDIWACEYDEVLRDLKNGWQKRITNQRARRWAFTRWRNQTGKETCDKLVLREAQSAINWVC